MVVSLLVDFSSLSLIILMRNGSMELTGSPRIVIAEDNPADVRLVREAFQEHAIDCDLQVIQDGEEVLTFIDRLNHDVTLPCPNLILLDLHLPKIHGREILEHLRVSERCRRTPVIVLSSSDAPWQLQQGERDGIVHFFRKPNKLEQFLELGGLVKEILGSRTPRSNDEGWGGAVRG